ncbi:MAG: YqaJ viral recombinase family protein, partial [Plesiomonas shigelloides]
MIYVNSITGVNTFEIEQGTDEWLRHRAGVITASRAHDIIKEGRKKGSVSESRKRYMHELVAQVCTGQVPRQVKFRQAEYGHEHEPLARAAYEAHKFEIVETCGLIYKDESMRCGVSPDGLTDVKGVEIKCPETSVVHVES